MRGKFGFWGVDKKRAAVGFRLLALGKSNNKGRVRSDWLASEWDARKAVEYPLAPEMSLGGASRGSNFPT